MTHADCPLIPETIERKGYCSLASCQKELPKRRRRWCSDKCVKYYLKVLNENHYFNSARRACKRRDKYACVFCGSKVKLQVDHIEPLWGDRRSFQCPGHHLSNLRTLCFECHKKRTRKQMEERACPASPALA